MHKHITVLKPHHCEIGAIKPFEDRIYSALLEKGYSVSERKVCQVEERILEMRKRANDAGAKGIQIERAFEFFLGLQDIERRLRIMLEEFSEGNEVLELHGYCNGNEGNVLIISKDDFVSAIMSKMVSAKRLLVYGVTSHRTMGLFGIGVESQPVDFDVLCDNLFGKSLSKILRDVGGLLKTVKNKPNNVLAVEIPGRREEVGKFEHIYGDEIEQIINDTSEFERNYVLSRLLPLDEEELLNIDEVAEAVARQFSSSPS